MFLHAPTLASVNLQVSKCEWGIWKKLDGLGMGARL
jgi:hypothetical protein